MQGLLIAILAFSAGLYVGWAHLDDLLDKYADADITVEEVSMPDEGKVAGDNTKTEEAAFEKVFDLTGKKFEFSETQITVQKGDTVVIHFESTDGLHDWVLDEFQVNTDRVRPEDGATSVSFVADQAGEFEYYCSVGNHRLEGMVGTLIVEDVGTAETESESDTDTPSKTKNTSEE